MEGHSGQKCNWIVTSIPLDRTACYSFVSCMPFDRAFMAFDRTRLSIVLGIRSYSTFSRSPHSVVLHIRLYSPFDRTGHSVILHIQSYSPFGRTPHLGVLPIRSYRAFGRTPHSIVPSIRSYSSGGWTWLAKHHGRIIVSSSVPTSPCGVRTSSSYKF